MTNPAPAANPVDLLRDEVRTTFTQMRDDFVKEITALKAEMQKMETQSLGAKLEAAITKLIKDRIDPLEQEVLKMSKNEVRTLRDESIIERTSLDRPFVFKGEASQSFNDWAHKVSVYMFGVGTSQSAHQLLKWCTKQTVPIVIKNVPLEFRDDAPKVSQNP